MSYGYSARLIEANKQADVNLPGVKLGRICIKHDVPIAKVAMYLGVSRQTVYNWFTGVYSPTPAIARRVSDFCAKYK